MSPISGRGSSAAGARPRAAHGWPRPPWRAAHGLARTRARFTTDPDRIALTFDDGPHPERTPRILDLLDEAGATATFFLVARRAVQFPQLVDRIKRSGHAVASHGLDHRFWPGLSSAALEAEIVGAQDALTDLTAEAPRLLRPPYGWSTTGAERLAAELGLELVFWSVDGLDYLPVSSKVVASRLRRARAGDIVLLHDGGVRRPATVDALELWLGAAPAPLRSLAP